MNGNKTVEQLRAEEKVEMATANNEQKRKEIYDKYDKLITPLLKDSKVNNKGEFFSKDIIQETQYNLEKGDYCVRSKIPTNSFKSVFNNLLYIFIENKYSFLIKPFH